jgi:hypothetical protein
MSRGFIKMMRSQDLLDFIRDEPKTFRLLTLIALRTNLFDCKNPFGCKLGEALVSAKAVGLSPTSYATAKKKLAKWGVAYFEVRREGSTSRTYARLLTDRFFDLNVSKTGLSFDNSSYLSNRAEMADELGSEGKSVNLCISNKKEENPRNHGCQACKTAT